VVLLHGFSGTHRAWDGVNAHLDGERYLPLALDLPGHGEASAEPHPITFPGCVAYVLARAPARFTLCGYSMGGRVALHVALAAPQQITRLVLIACRPGIEDERERAERRRADEALARELETGPFEQFVQRWRSQQLFAGEPPEAAARARADQLRNRPYALAAVLRGIGVGQMEPLWQRLDELRMPVTVVVGRRDRRFQRIGRRMVQRLPRAALCVVDGGHGLPLENPAAVAAVLERAP